MSTKPYWAPDNSEDTVRKFLAERDLRAQKIPVADGKRPDFQVYQDDKMEFYCEVKELTDADPLEDYFVDIVPGIQVAEQLKSGHARQYRIAKCIHTAVKQFDEVNKGLNHPNVLAFVNWDDLCTIDDLKDLLAGGLELSSGTRITFAPAVAHRQIADDRGRIHAFIWINHVPQEKPFHIFYWNRPCCFTNRLKDLLATQ